MRLLGVMLCAAVVLCAARPSHACSCVRSPGARQEMAHASAVFEGRVTSLEHEPAKHRLTARFEVVRRWKGAESGRVDVITLDQGSLCGYPFEKGKRYLVFAGGDEGTLLASACSRTGPIEAAGADIAALEREEDEPGGTATVPDAGSADAGVGGGAAAAEAGPESPPAPAPSAQPAAAASAPANPPPIEPAGAGCAGCATCETGRSSTGMALIAAAAAALGIARRRSVPRPVCRGRGSR